MIREPLPTEAKHECSLPGYGVEPGTYLECDICGKDWVAADLPSWTDARWNRVHWWNRAKIRRSVGIDDNCPVCSPVTAAYRKRRRDRRLGGYRPAPLCSRHEIKNPQPPEGPR